MPSDLKPTYTNAELSQIEKDLIHLWDNFRCEPTYMQMELSQLRKLEAERGDAKDYVLEFLRDTADLPGEAIAVLTPGKITILVDDDGELLGFS
jgi:hypothetical protein